MQEAHAPQRILMGPGPSNVPQPVLDALAQPTVGHLDPWFIELMDEIRELQRTAFRTESPYSFTLSAPGSSGMESCLINLIEPGDEVLVCINGVFGGRMAEIARRAGATVHELSFPWGEAVDPAEVERALESHPEISLLAFVHAETSTGALSHPRELSRLAHRHDALVVVDAVTALGGVELEVDGWELDAVYAGSQKCLSCVPGLSPVVLSERAWRRVEGRSRPVQSWFMDFTLLAGYWRGARRAYHHTAPVNALYAWHEALRGLCEEGLENAWNRHRHHHEALRAGLEALGLELKVAPDIRLPQLNVVGVPDGIDDGDFRSRLLREHSLEIGAGLGDLAGSVWRIGLMGYNARREAVLTCLEALAETLGLASGEAVQSARSHYDDGA